MREWTVRLKSTKSAQAYPSVVVAWCIQRSCTGQNTVL